MVDDKILCMHGGLSPELSNLEQIKRVVRPTAAGSARGELRQSNLLGRMFGFGTQQVYSLVGECEQFRFATSYVFPDIPRMSRALEGLWRRSRPASYCMCVCNPSMRHLPRPRDMEHPSNSGCRADLFPAKSACMCVCV